MGGQTAGETMAFDCLARVGGRESESMHSERVDGYNPLAVVDAIKRKKALLEEGKDRFFSRRLLTAIPDILLPMLHPTA